MEVQHYDAIIIGSGQAGNPLALTLAGENKKVALIESKHAGGTCVNVGCTPTKAYVASARRAWEARHGQDLGVFVPEGVRIQLRQVKQRKDALVKESREALQKSLDGNSHISLIRAEARFTGFKTLEADGRRLFAEQIFINTGASTRVPEGFSKVDYLTNESILELEELPGHLLVVGGNYLGLEFAQMFRRFGSQVTIIEQQARLAPKEDEEVSHTLQQIMEAEGIELRLKAACTEAFSSADGTITVRLDCQEASPTATGTHLLVAVGRSPNTHRLNLQATGLDVDEKGYLQVNDHLETNVSGIYALGDCNGIGAFTHTSYNDYQILTDNLLKGKDRKVSDRIPTYCVYTDPPLARAGMTRAQALEKGYRLLQATLPMSQVNRAREKGETRGFMSAIIDADTYKILGATILGTAADEVIASLLHAMYAGMPYNMIRNIMIPHPTVSELIPTMMESAKPVE